MLDTTRIAPHLYQGSFPPEGSAVHDAGFDVLVLCAAELQPAARAYPGVTVIHCPMWDADLTKAEWKRAGAAAEKVAVALCAGKRVLVTCAAGRNRSGLVTALALHVVTPRSSGRIVRHIQKTRRNALTNQAFVRAIEAVRPVSVAA